MVSERNRKLKAFLENLGITVNIGTTRARGNKGFFKSNGKDLYRIDVAGNLTPEATSSVLVHEFAHFLHYQYDKSLKNLDFIFSNYQEDILDELVNITVNEIPKDFAASLFNKKEELTRQIKQLSLLIKETYPQFKLSTPFKPIERTVKMPVKFLLKYDKVSFFNRVYSVDTLEADFNYLSQVQIAYIVLKSKQRAQARINSKISRLNRYYNKPTELFARFMELYILDNHKALELAPQASALFSKAVSDRKLPLMTEFLKIFK